MSKIKPNKIAFNSDSGEILVSGNIPGTGIFVAMNASDPRVRKHVYCNCRERGVATFSDENVMSIPFKFSIVDEIEPEIMDATEDIYINSDALVNPDINNNSDIVSLYFWSPTNSKEIIVNPLEGGVGEKVLPDRTIFLPVFSWENSFTKSISQFSVLFSDKSLRFYTMDDDLGEITEISTLEKLKIPVDIDENTKVIGSGSSSGTFISGDTSAQISNNSHVVKWYMSDNKDIVSLADKKIWGHNLDSGNIYEFENENGVLSKIPFSKVSNVKKIVYSDYHGALFAMTETDVFFIDEENKEPDIIYSIESGNIKDIDVSKSGELIVMTNNSVKILKNDFYSILLNYEIDQNPVLAKFSDKGKATIITESSNTRIFFWSDSITSSIEIEELGMASVFSTKNDSLDLLLFNNGKMYRIDHSNRRVELIYDYEEPTISGGNSGVVFLDESSEQEKVRVFVGSKPMSNDRWDSGEVETSKSKMAYGGGDNLVPGQKYYYHITTCVDGKWSEPSMSDFVVPKYEQE